MYHDLKWEVVITDDVLVEIALREQCSCIAPFKASKSIENAMDSILMISP